MRLRPTLCLLLVIPVTPMLWPHSPAPTVTRPAVNVTQPPATPSPCAAADVTLTSDAVPAFPVTIPSSKPQAVPGMMYPTYLTQSLWLSSYQVINVKSGTADLAIFDTVTGQQTLLEGVDEIGIGSHQKQFRNPFAVRTSPQGRWILWPSGSESEPTWIALSVDGQERREWPRTTDAGGAGTDTAWMQDDRHWVEVFRTGSELSKASGTACANSYKVRVYDTETPEVREFPLIVDPSCKPFFLPVQDSFGQFVFTQDGRAWLSTLWTYSAPTPQYPFSGSRYNAYQLEPGKDAWTLSPSEVSLMSYKDVRISDECVRSPDDNWLIWRNYAVSGEGPRRLVLTRSDGSSPQIILESPESENLCYIHWAEDSQAVAFYKDNFLYRLPLGDVEAKTDAQCSTWQTRMALNSTILRDHTFGKFPRPSAPLLTASKR